MRWLLPATALSLLSLATLAQAPAAPRDAEQLRAFYQQNCVRCHGLDGSAKDPEGKKLKGRDLTDPSMKNEKDASLEKTIRKGIFFGKAMPAFGKELSDAEIQLLVKEVVRKAEKGKAIAPAGAAK
jgi:mono/diheme cytochrome c family protein